MESSESTNEPLARIDCKQGLIKAVRFNADGQYALSCGADRSIKLWRPSKLMQLKCYKGHSSDVTDCQSNDDSSKFISCSSDRSVILWDVESGKILRRYRNLAPFNSICYGSGCSTALAASADGTVRIYDLRTLNAWDPIQSLTEASDCVTCCRVRGHFIYTSSLDKGLRVYDLRKGSLSVDSLHVALNHVSPATAGSGGLVLVSCLRAKPVLVDLAEARILSEYTGNENKLFRLESSFVMSDTCVAAGSENGKVCIWKLNSPDAPQRILEHPNINPPVIQSLSAHNPDRLLTACGQSMFLWSLAESAEKAVS